MTLFRRKKRATRSSEATDLPKPAESNGLPAQPNELVIMPYTMGELAEIYNVSRPTMRRWLYPFLAEIGGLIGRYFTCLQVETIFRRLGFPGKRIQLSGS
ncbi:hypothetical protein WBG78_07320 [Chryseolinea sp. T2]|uniref:hypothetical protein n=1 Tax=Chryseolinea sp. T2 TaxID=3129255 RepID=UPI00307808C8